MLSQCLEVTGGADIEGSQTKISLLANEELYENAQLSDFSSLSSGTSSPTSPYQEIDLETMEHNTAGGATAAVDWKNHPISKARLAFFTYKEDNIAALIEPRRRYLSSLQRQKGFDSPGDIFMREKMRVKIGRATEVVESHSRICESILQSSAYFFPISTARENATSPDDQAIARASIRQLYRDWSAEAKDEREVCFKPILSAIQSIAQEHADSKDSFRVLVPGAGLCRLACEVAKIGSFPVVANELSYHQMLAVHWILASEQGTPTRPFTISPWGLQFSNHIRAGDQFRDYKIPEPGSTILQDGQKPPVLMQEKDDVLLRCANLTVTPYDFRSYGAAEHTETFSVVTTAFFLDTAPNVLEYVKVINNVLQPGGTWLNVGPLLWNCFENGPGGRQEGDHDDDEAARVRQISENRQSSFSDVLLFDEKVELAWDEVIELIETMGFEVEENIPNLGAAGYIMDTESMLLPTYQVGFFRVTKSRAA